MRPVNALACVSVFLIPGSRIPGKRQLNVNWRGGARKKIVNVSVKNVKMPGNTGPAAGTPAETPQQWQGTPRTPTGRGQCHASQFIC